MGTVGGGVSSGTRESFAIGARVTGTTEDIGAGVPGAGGAFCVVGFGVGTGVDKACEIG